MALFVYRLSKQKKKKNMAICHAVLEYYGDDDLASVSSSLEKFSLR